MTRLIVIRLGSLGDVILATSFLRALNQGEIRTVDSSLTQVEWVVKKEFAELLSDHPGVDRVWEYDSKTGLKGWLKLISELLADSAHPVASGAEQPRLQIWDLHQTPRSRIFRWAIRSLALTSRSGSQKVSVHAISKQRWRLWGYFIFKKMWPASLRPRHWISVFADAGEKARESIISSTHLLKEERAVPNSPSLTQLAEKKSGPWLELNSRISEDGSGQESQKKSHQKSLAKPYWVVMPSTAWRSKEWPAKNWAEWLKTHYAPHVVVLGTPRDNCSRQLLTELKNLKISCESLGLEKKERLTEIVRVLKGAERYCGVDTGLSHLAQSLGLPCTLFFGPTDINQGFGPWGMGAHTLESNVGCRPCGKDGRTCLRLWERRACLTRPVQERQDLDVSWLREPSVNFREWLYLAVSKMFLAPLLSRFLKRSKSSELSVVRELQRYQKQSKSELLYWFHAASAGELEILLPVIEKELEQNLCPSRVWVSAWSPSAQSSLLKLRERWPSLKDRLFVSWSPLEGEWGAIFRVARPKAWITAKYEAWPELWIAARKWSVPLTIVGARSQASSLVWAKRVLKWLGVSTPTMGFLPYDQKHSQALLQEFKGSSVFPVQDPRWDRVLRRATSTQERAQRWLQEWNQASPSGEVFVLGSLWKEDLPVLESAIRSLIGHPPEVVGSHHDTPRGTQKSQTRLNISDIVLVPHDLNRENVAFFQSWIERLEAIGYVSGTGEGNSSSPRFHLVREMGILFEIYSIANLVYVGGGFSKGIHSTLEPAWYGLPICGGPKNADKFYEVQELTEAGQLTLVKNASELMRWLSEVGLKSQIERDFNRNRWIKSSQNRCGGAAQVHQWLHPEGNKI